MKLYHINPNDYGSEYFIMSTSRESALVALKRFYLKMSEDKSNSVWSIYKRDYDKLWADASIDSLPKEYTIDEHGFNDVVVAERG